MKYLVDWVKLERDGLLLVTLSGPADATIVKGLMDELEAATMLRPIRILVDETALDPGFLSAMDVRDIAEWWQETRGLRDSQVAVVAPRDVIFGLNRMFQLNAGLDRESGFGVFRSRSEALDWLGERRGGSA